MMMMMMKMIVKFVLFISLKIRWKFLEVSEVEDKVSGFRKLNTNERTRADFLGSLPLFLKYLRSM